MSMRTPIRPLSIFSLLFTGLFALPLSAQNPGDNIFEGIQVHTVKLTFPTANFWDSLTVLYYRGDEQCIVANAELDGVRMDSIGVRFKGNSSFTYPGVKKSLKLELDEFRSQKWDGLKAVHLNNSWGDPTMMREKVILDFCRDAGVYAPRANYAQVFINDTLWGLYSLIEHVDKTFLKSHLGTNDGNLFKAVDDFRAVPPQDEVLSDFRWFGTAESLYHARYELKTDGSLTAWPQLVALLDAVNNDLDPASAIPRYANIESLSRAFATDLLFGNLDSYCGSGRNFYIYFHKTTGIMSWIMWDVGLGFGIYPSGTARPESISLLYRSSDAFRPLAAKLFDTPEFQYPYLETVCNLAHGLFGPTALAHHIDSIGAVIRPYVYADPHCMYTPAQFEMNIEMDIDAEGGGSVRKPGLKAFLAARSLSVLNQLSAKGISCQVEVDHPSAPTTMTLNGNYPNPVTSTTAIDFTLDVPTHVLMDVWNLLGERVLTLLDTDLPSGRNSVTVPAGTLKEGVYYYRLHANGQFLSGKLIKIK